ncbi:NADH dehydrogenase [ubiquinone] 1 beta subcomplex subunit 10-like [Anneissia japonica]|uniref:NADH dehydrogenase [ubiquinone] 1 beta subcomplex subunit 10-like n=1 Tax=Anneissia japonica TaxID=1529436 RepID=UPI001425724B|nr:NADH dehydrogenase [ubiquinone] 1 beta subcomplex subunit 10-like [Anneissia japonica]
MGVIDDFLLSAFYYTVDAPVTYARSFIERQRAKNPIYYYHRRYPRVTEMWDCNEDDIVCMFEAESQYQRDRVVDQEILTLLKKTVGRCYAEQGHSAKIACRSYLDDYEEAADNYYTKYGELGFHGNARRCYSKQQHRMVDERRRAQEQEN